MRKIFVSAGFIIAVVISAVLENKFANYEKNIVTLLNLTNIIEEAFSKEDII